MQAEAGQSLSHILARKELERACGNGLFVWGVGNALGPRLHQFIDAIEDPRIYFSIMRAKPKRIDEFATSIILWTAYVAANGDEAPLPSHTIVLSRGATARGSKSRHYGLFCHSERELTASEPLTIDFKHLRNLGSTSSGLGFSQVTAIVEHVPLATPGTPYPVAFGCSLVAPFFVQLARPRLISDGDRTALERVANEPTTVDDWRTLAASLRTKYR